MSQEDDLMEAYARLKALHENMPDPSHRVVEQVYVEDFHEILGLLQQYSSVDLGRFKVPVGAIVGRYPRSLYDLQFVKSKVAALLAYFDLRWSEEKPTVGFRPK